MVDAATGITELDNAMADLLRRSTKPVFLVVNKVDNNERLLEASEFYSLGFENIFFISSISGSGTGEILDAVTALISEEDAADTQEEGLPNFAIIGQPNVGKSSLLNALIGQERTIVSDIAGTTRDTIHTHYNLFNKEFILIDTAGIRRKAKVHEDLEFYSVLRAIKALDEADVCLQAHAIHHKFVVIDFNKPTCRVYCGSSNLALGGEKSNGDNLIEIRDPEIVTVFAIEALRLVVHYHFRANQIGAVENNKPITLKKTNSWTKPYFNKNDIKFLDRNLFCG